MSNHDHDLVLKAMDGFWGGVKTMPCLPPITGNGKHSTVYGDDWGMVYYSTDHIYCQTRIDKPQTTVWGVPFKDEMLGEYPQRKHPGFVHDRPPQ